MKTYKTMLVDACVVCATITLSLLLRRWKRRRGLPLPPGPRGLPIVGNMFQVPSVRLWETAMEWGKKYGDITYLEIAGMPMMIVNSHDVALDLLTKRSANYSSRPQLVMPNLAGWSWVTSLIPYGDSLRRQRTILHRFFQSPDTLNYKEIQERERRVFLRSMLQSPADYGRHVRCLLVSVIALNTYGHEMKSEDDRFMKLGEESVLALIEAANHLYMDFFPWLRHLPKWFPGGSFQKFVTYSRELSALFKREVYDLNKRKRLDGTAKESMTTIFLDEQSDINGDVADEEDFKDAAATVFFAGSDTSITAIMNFVLAMLNNPEVQRRAQEEIDSVIGNDRLPTFEDKDQLPYISAVCLELLRWEVVTPFGFIHTAAEEDEYCGYYIPAGTMIFPNIWATARDENLYPDPLTFKPERWLPGGSSFNSLRPGEFVFGYGRRVCPGQAWAEHMMYITAVSLLATFNIEQALDSNGMLIPPNDEHKSAVVRVLGPSKCKITPRSEKIASLVRDCVEV